MNRREVAFGIGGAVGGTILGVISDIAVESYKASNERVRDNAAREAKALADRRELLEALAGNFDDLGDIPRRAVEYVENGREGSPGDVRAVKRHFDRVIRVLRAGAASPEEIATYYGGRLRGWGVRFTDLGNDRSPVSRRFTDYERYNFRLIGPALTGIANTLLPGPSSDDADAVVKLHAVENVTMENAM